MQYLLMIYRNEVEYAKRDAATPPRRWTEYGAFTQSIIQSGNFKAGDRLQDRPRPRPRCGFATARR